MAASDTGIRGESRDNEVSSQYHKESLIELCYQLVRVVGEEDDPLLAHSRSGNQDSQRCVNMRAFSFCLASKRIEKWFV